MSYNLFYILELSNKNKTNAMTMLRFLTLQLGMWSESKGLGFSLFSITLPQNQCLVPWYNEKICLEICDLECWMP